MRHLLTFALCCCAAAAAAESATATTVRFTSNVGTFDVALTDAVTPATVANFLSYVNAHAYDNTFVHRAVPGFVIQGGGYLNAPPNLLSPIATNPPIANEFALDLAAAAGGPVNVRGTIAMAKVSGNPDSATSQFFFNLADNSSNLDNQNGGFTTFGTVVGSGMSVIDAIAALPQINAGDPFNNLPLAGDGQPTFANLVTFSSVTVIPEPALLGLTGLSAVALRRRRPSPR